VLSHPSILESIEVPILDNIERVLKDQLNTLVSSTLSTSSRPNPEIKLPMFNLSNDMLQSTLKTHLSALENLHKEQKPNCTHFINRMQNLNYWLELNPSYRDASLSERLSNVVNAINTRTHRCKNKDNFALTTSALRRHATQLLPSEGQTEELLIRQITKLGERGNLSVEVFI